MRYLIPLFLLSLSGQVFAQTALPLNCPGGTVIELDGQVVCEKQDTLALLISDFEASELAGDIYRLGYEGDREALKQLPNISAEAIDAKNEVTTKFLARHAALASQSLNEKERLNYDLLGFVLTQRQRLAPFDQARVPFRNDSGFFNELTFVLRQTEFKTPQDYEAYAARLTRLPRFFAQAKENMRRGIRTQFTASSEILPGIQDMIKNMAEASPETHPLFAPFKAFPDSMTEEDQTRLRALGEAALKSAAIPAYRDLSKFMANEYATSARMTAGLGTSDSEREYYRAVTRYYTTLDISPDEVHELGLSEVKRIRNEMDAITERGQAGNYVVNTYNLPNRPLYNLPALTAHEGVPGHHMQISIGQELKDLPKFRKSLYPNAFGEGWGLYAEKLAGEMGIYQTPYERFGQLSYEMWRACRLVVDTGLHWKGWSREQAENCFMENSALAPHNIKTEVERYISWPGQALAYKIGELKILELRKKATEELGENFDIRRFHDAVLSNGGIPLNILEKQIDRFIFEEKQRLAQSLSDPASSP